MTRALEERETRLRNVEEQVARLQEKLALKQELEDIVIRASVLKSAFSLANSSKSASFSLSPSSSSITDFYSSANRLSTCSSSVYNF